MYSVRGTSLAYCELGATLSRGDAESEAVGVRPAEGGGLPWARRGRLDVGREPECGVHEPNGLGSVSGAG